MNYLDGSELSGGLNQALIDSDQRQPFAFRKGKINAIVYRVNQRDHHFAGARRQLLDRHKPTEESWNGGIGGSRLSLGPQALPKLLPDGVAEFRQHQRGRKLWLPGIQQSACGFAIVLNNEPLHSDAAVENCFHRASRQARISAVVSPATGPVSERKASSSRRKPFHCSVSSRIAVRTASLLTSLRDLESRRAFLRIYSSISSSRPRIRTSLISSISVPFDINMISHSPANGNRPCSPRS
jgi:hypothetical protein